MKQAKTLVVALIVFLLIVVAGFLSKNFIDMQKVDKTDSLKEIHAVTVAYDEDEDGPILIVRNEKNGKLVYLHFPGEITEEVYGADVKSVIDNKEYNVRLLVYYVREYGESKDVVDMLYVLAEED